MNIEDIKRNELSFNKGTKFGDDMILQSLRKLGFGRSVLVDKNDVLISGDKVTECAKKMGIKNVRVVETTGDELIVVKRTDLDATTRKGLEMSLVDNLSQERNLYWDADAMHDAVTSVLGFDPREWQGHNTLIRDLNVEDLLKDDVEVIEKRKKEENFTQISQPSLFD